MEQQSELQRLEKFVEKILTRFSALKAEKAQLEQDVFERDLLIEELRDNISSQVTERNEISDRVNKIVDQIEDWELNLEQGGDVATNESNESPDLDDDGERVQHDLFSMSGSKE